MARKLVPNRQPTAGVTTRPVPLMTSPTGVVSKPANVVAKTSQPSRPGDGLTKETDPFSTPSSREPEEALLSDKPTVLHRRKIACVNVQT